MMKLKLLQWSEDKMRKMFSDYNVLQSLKHPIHN